MEFIQEFSTKNIEDIDISEPNQHIANSSDATSDSNSDQSFNHCPRQGSVEQHEKATGGGKKKINIEFLESKQRVMFSVDSKAAFELLSVYSIQFFFSIRLCLETSNIFEKEGWIAQKSL